jgi:phenylacetate-CoA ligase
MAEAVGNASQCPEGYLHLDEDFAAVELLPLKDGTGFQVVGTALSNHATPLIRYVTGDVVSAIGHCNCGRPGRALESMDGRAEDSIVLADGSQVGGLNHVFKHLTAIREAQVHQHVVGAVTVKVLRRDGYRDADDELLRRELHKRLGADVDIDVEYVEALPRSASGKLRLVVSHLKLEQPRYRTPGDSSAEMPFSQS